ncbi:hypothetical protein C823_007646 [Eubacterium plexicaudatum ASF492]|nr:hypothetical protein C823_007646 [Eubacterium plexicaudatum ASF492]
MKVSSPNKPVQTITNKIKREQILFTHKLQRPEGVWNNNQKSLLIDSLLRGYLINPTYTVLENGKQYVIDGVQRLYSIYTFINDGYRLSKNLEPIVIDEETYEIAGKKFSKLDEKVRDELSAAQLQVCEISDYTDKDVREMFRRLNSGKPLNTTQKMTPDMSDELSDAVLSIVLHPFFQKVLTPAQLKSSVDLSIAIEILMLSEISDKYDFGSFRKDDRQKFIQYYNERVDLEKIELIKQGLDRLDESIPEDVKINKTTISFICYGAYRIVKDNKSFENLWNQLIIS